MKDFDYTVSLRIRHPSIDPREITKQLGFSPQHSWRAGDRKGESGGESREGKYRETYWLARVPMAPAEMGQDLPLDNALMFALLQIKRCDGFWNSLLAGGGSARLIVEAYGGDDFTLELSQPTLAMLVRFRIAISVDVHADPHEVALTA